MNKIVQAVLNSTVSILADENNSRQYGGGGGPRSVMVYEVQSQVVVAPSAFSLMQREQLSVAFDEMARREILSIFNEILQPDRRVLDDIVFDVLGLTGSEREAVYEAVVELVRRRLEKAKSV